MRVVFVLKIKDLDSAHVIFASDTTQVNDLQCSAHSRCRSGANKREMHQFVNTTFFTIVQ